MELVNGYILDSCIKSYFYQSIHIKIMKSDARGGSKVIFLIEKNEFQNQDFDLNIQKFRRANLHRVRTSLNNSPTNYCCHLNELLK